MLNFFCHVCQKNNKKYILKQNNNFPLKKGTSRNFFKNHQKWSRFMTPHETLQYSTFLGICICTKKISANEATCFALTRYWLATFETMMMMMVNVVCSCHYYCFSVKGIMAWHANKHWEFNRNFMAFVLFFVFRGKQYRKC